MASSLNITGTFTRGHGTFQEQIRAGKFAQHEAAARTSQAEPIRDSLRGTLGPINSLADQGLAARQAGL
jgi:hypothetical protein